MLYVKVADEDKGVAVHVMKAYGRSGGIASLIHNIGTFMPRLLDAWAKEAPIPTKWKAGWASELV
jgi:hypothetical protein